MKSRYLTFLLLFIGLGSALAEPPALTREFSSTYSLSRGFLVFGKTTRTMKRNADNSYTFESTTTAVDALDWILKGHVIETSTWKYQDGTAIPMRYQYDKTGGKKNRNVILTFNWEKNIVTNDINSDPWRMSIEPGTLDKHLYQLLIMEDLRRGKTDISYQIADGGKLKDYTFKVIGREMIDTPLGQFNAIKVKRVGDKRKTIFWCAEELDYFAVQITQIEKDGEKYVAILENYNGATSAEELQQLSAQPAASMETATPSQ